MSVAIDAPAAERPQPAATSPVLHNDMPLHDEAGRHPFWATWNILYDFRREGLAMRKVMIRRVTWMVFILATFSWICVASRTTGEEASSATATSTGEAAATPMVPFRGRLPNYYAQVVDQKQREEIYRIQGEYASKIAELRAKLDALTQERDEKVAAVLSTDQLKKVEELREAAKAKRAERAEAAKEDDETAEG